MTCVLGWPLSEAEARLAGDGFRVETLLVRCRKDVPAGEARVIRQETLSDGVVLLHYAEFRTEAEQT